jgi:hypothetical protein
MHLCINLYRRPRICWRPWWRRRNERARAREEVQFFVVSIFICFNFLHRWLRLGITLIETPRAQHRSKKARLYFNAISLMRMFPNYSKWFASSMTRDLRVLFCFVRLFFAFLTRRYMRLSKEKLQKWDEDPEEFLVDQMNETHTLKYEFSRAVFCYSLMLLLFIINCWCASLYPASEYLIMLLIRFSKKNRLIISSIVTSAFQSMCRFCLHLFVLNS